MPLRRMREVVGSAHTGEAWPGDPAAVLRGAARGQKNGTGDHGRSLRPRRASPAVAQSLIWATIFLLPADVASGQACPIDMLRVEEFCIDLRESPNVSAALPLVMYSFDEAEAWCLHRGRRLCFDDEWTRACAGAADLSYPYGDEHMPGDCNDEEPWIAYDQVLLNAWPAIASGPAIGSLADLLDAARAVSSEAEAAADHVEFLYQGEPSGSNSGCVSSDGVLDLCGNVEEWTRRRDGGTTGFSGALKGRYWAESRTCQQAETAHGDAHRFYELGFRCCRDLNLIFEDGFEAGDTSAWSYSIPQTPDS